MKCPQCHNDNRDDAKFCNTCGECMPPNFLSNYSASESNNLRKESKLFEATPRLLNFFTLHKCLGTPKIIKILILLFTMAALYLLWIRIGTNTSIDINLGSGVKIKFIRISAGTFQMGSPDNESCGWSGERPVRKVKISKDFYIGQYEVTQQQWKVVTGNNPSYPTKGDNYPVTCVSWKDCQDFISVLNSKNLGYGTFRLPTEAEWEYSCRAGTQTRFYWGDDPSNTIIMNYAWYSNNSSGTIHPVGQKLPNSWGLYDMSGNVSEVCQDNWHDNYENAPNNEKVWGDNSSNNHVERGGSWGSSSNEYKAGCRSAYRASRDPNDYSNLMGGLRLVLSPGK